jgi:predicted enzyme related to lactoylglutathione lyase
MANQIIHAEVLGRDAAALGRFFADVFGWNIDTNNPGGYGMTTNEETGIVFGVGPTQDGSAGHVTFYVRVPDIDAALEKATKLGGSVIAPKFNPSPDATLALMADPEGHVIGLSE